MSLQALLELGCRTIELSAGNTALLFIILQLLCWYSFKQHQLHQFYIIILKTMQQIEFQRCSLNRLDKKIGLHQLSLKQIPSSHKKPAVQLQSKIIVLFNHKINEHRKIYFWRRKTEFPIVKIDRFQLKSQNSTNCIVQLTYEAYPIRIVEVKDLPLFKTLYLLKESLVGYERLYFRFRGFTVTAGMIALDQLGKCKVWLNEDFAKNGFKRAHIDEQTFLKSILKVFQERVNKSKANKNFFTQIFQCKDFISALFFIEKYARENRVIISTSCRLLEKEKEGLCKSQIGAPSFRSSQTSVHSSKHQPPTPSNDVHLTALHHQEPFRISFNPAYQVPFFGSNQSQPLIHYQTPPKNTNYNPQHIKKSKSDQTAPETPSNIHPEQRNQEVPWVGEFQNVLFGNQFQQPQSLVAKSELFDKKCCKKQSNIRKLSEQQQQISWFDSKKKIGDPVTNLNSSKRGLWQDNNEFSLEGDQAQKSYISVVTQNNWKMKVKGLFNDQGGQVKKSMHEGKESRLQIFGRLQLLQNYGIQINQSFASEQSEPL